MSRVLCALIAPPFCAFCKSYLLIHVPLCKKCIVKIRPIVSHSLVITKTKIIPVFAISDYKDPMRSLILAKGSRNCAVARQLGDLIWYNTDIKLQQFDYIIPVPLHWRRYAWRGYNQAYEMAHVLGKHSQKKVICALQRVRNTKHQAELSHDERSDNVRSVFIVRTSMHALLQGKRILLVDDLMTTGSTLRACVRELYKYNPKSVIAVVASRVV